MTTVKMSKITVKCNRCGKETIVKNTNDIPLRWSYVKINGLIGKELDLCEDCTKTLIEWIKRKDAKQWYYEK